MGGRFGYSRIGPFLDGSHSVWSWLRGVLWQSKDAGLDCAPYVDIYASLRFVYFQLHVSEHVNYPLHCLYPRQGAIWGTLELEYELGPVFWEHCVELPIQFIPLCKVFLDAYLANIFVGDGQLPRVTTEELCSGEDVGPAASACGISPSIGLGRVDGGLEPVLNGNPMAAGVAVKHANMGRETMPFRAIGIGFASEFLARFVGWCGYHRRRCALSYFNSDSVRHFVYSCGLGMRIYILGQVSGKSEAVSDAPICQMGRYADHQSHIGCSLGVGIAAGVKVAVRGFDLSWVRVFLGHKRTYQKFFWKIRFFSYPPLG